MKMDGYNTKKENQTIEQLENEPAYIRKKIKIKTDTPAVKKDVSKYKLSEDEDNGGPKLREDNSYLHDNVD
jgi:cell division protein FtsZ